jgi:hypothetical protein
LRVIDAFGRITCVVVVKSPVSDGVQQPTMHILDNVEVLGRAYDYVLELQNYYGQRDIFVFFHNHEGLEVNIAPAMQRARCH